MKLTLIYHFYQKSLLWWIDNDDEEEDDGIGNQKSKLTKKCVIKRKLKFEDYFNCLGANRFENKINHLQNNKIDVDSLKEFLKTIDQYYQSINQSKDLEARNIIYSLKKFIKLQWVLTHFIYKIFQYKIL